MRTFFEIFGKFVNKNAIKSDFWSAVGRYISKISKKSPFLGKKYIYQLPKILRYIYQGGVDSPKIPLIPVGLELERAIEFDPGTVKATQGWCSSILASSELVVIDPSRFEARQRWSNYFWVESELLRSGHDYSR